MSNTNRNILIIGLGLILLFAFVQGDGGGFGSSAGPVAVLIVEETEDRSKLPASQLDILNSTELREWAKTHCDKDADGSPQFRVLDKDADVSRMSQFWQERMTIAKTRSLPYLAVSNGKTGADGDLPLTLDKTKSILERYSGK